MDDRDQRLARGMSASVAYRVVSAIAPLAIVPLALSSLGKDTYGIWMTIVSVTAVLSFGDLGLGNGLMTEVARLRATAGGEQTIPRVVSSAYAIVSATAASLLVVALLIIWFGPWQSHANADQTRWIATVAVSGFLMNVPASLIVRLMFAYEEADRSYLWQTLGPIISLSGAMLASKGGSATMFVTASTLGPLIANVLATGYWFGRHSEVRSRSRRPTLGDARSIMATAGTFLAISIVMTLALNIDMALISGFLSTRAAADYGVPWRAYSQLGMMLSLVAIPFWSAAGVALASGHHDWVRRRVRLLTTVNLGLTIPLGLLGIVFGPEAIAAWVGPTIEVHRLALAGFGAWWCVMALMYPMFMVQNGAGVLMPQLLGWAAFLLLSTASKIALLSAGNWTWIPLVQTGCYLLTVFPGGIFGYRLAMRAADLSASERTAV